MEVWIVLQDQDSGTGSWWPDSVFTSQEDALLRAREVPGYVCDDVRIMPFMLDVPGGQTR